MIIDKIENAALYSGINPRFSQAFDYLKNTDLVNLEAGKHEIDGENLFALVQEYDTKSEEDALMESHFKHIDIQYIIEGKELMGLVIKKDQVPTLIDAEKDYAKYQEDDYSFMLFEEGMFGIYFPEDIHLPNIQLDEPARVKKIVIKVKI
jgi:YhcH/YjgK/YiaL family protein